MVPYHPAAIHCVAFRKNPAILPKTKTRKRRKINASGSRSGGIRTRGLLVPNSRIWISDRAMRIFAIFTRLCNEKPRISENFRFFHAIFKVDILPFRLILKVQFGVQPGRLQHSPGHALPFGQSCTPSNSLILLFFSSTRALERPYIRSTSFASRMNLSTSSYDSSKP